MRIQPGRPAPPTPQPPPAPFDPGVDPYYGPVDGLSHSPQFPRVRGPALTAGLSMFCRVEYRGLENLPRSGANVSSPNPISILDVPILFNLGVQDLRTMVNSDLFQFPLIAKGLACAGAFPVNQVTPSDISKEHTLDVLRQGKGLGIFPEGQFTREGELGKIGAFKKGAAAAAILGGADKLVPIAIHYHPDEEIRPVECMLRGAASTVVALAGVEGLKHPALAAGVSVLGGTLAGAALGGAIGRSLVKNAAVSDPTPKFAAGAAGGALGALAGGLLGQAATCNQKLMLGLSLAGGLATFALASAWIDREVATVEVGVPIDVAPYRAQAETDRKGAVQALTAELHERVGRLKEGLSGVPYDAGAEKVTTARPTVHFRPGVSLEETRNWQEPS